MYVLLYSSWRPLHLFLQGSEQKNVGIRVWKRQHYGLSFDCTGIFLFKLKSSGMYYVYYIRVQYVSIWL